MDDLITWLRAQLDEDERYADEYPPFQARALREVEAKRAIIAKWELHSDAKYPDSEGGYASAMDDAVALIAAVYSDRPGYREEWRP